MPEWYGGHSNHAIPRPVHGAQWGRGRSRANFHHGCLLCGGRNRSIDEHSHKQESREEQKPNE